MPGRVALAFLRSSAGDTCVALWTESLRGEWEEWPGKRLQSCRCCQGEQNPGDLELVPTVSSVLGGIRTEIQGLDFIEVKSQVCCSHWPLALEEGLSQAWTLGTPVTHGHGKSGPRSCISTHRSPRTHRKPTGHPASYHMTTCPSYICPQLDKDQ